MTTVELKYQEKCRTPSDIYQHLPTLRRYAAQCSHVTELGVRTVVSTWAFLAGLQPAAPGGQTLVSVDIATPEEHGGNWNEVMDAADAAGVELHFIKADDRTIDLADTDLLFIDTWHVYEQLKAELDRHAHRARKFIILHDTVTFATRGETEGHQGLMPAIEEFLAQNHNWKCVENFDNCNGLMVLKRLGRKL